MTINSKQTKENHFQPAFANGDYLMTIKKVFPIFWMMILVLAPIHCYGQSYLDRVVAVVNGDIILDSDIELFQNEFVRDFLPLDFGVTPQGKTPTDSEVLQELIIIKLIEQAAQKKDIRFGDKDIDLMINQLGRRNDMKKGQFYMLAAARGGLNTKQLRSLVLRRGLLTEMIRREIVSKITISERELQNYFKDNRDKIDEQFDELTQAVPEIDVEKRVEEMMKSIPPDKDIYSGGRVRLRQITLKMPDKNNKAAMEKLRDTVRKIHDEVTAGADFGKLAKKYSSDNYASNGGDLGWMKTKDYIPELQKLINQLAVGSMSQPLPMQDRLILLYLSDAKGRKTKKIPRSEAELKEMEKQVRMLVEESVKRAKAARKNMNRNSDSDQNKREAQDLGLLNPDEKEDFEKKWDKVEAVFRSKKIKDRQAKWIEELKENAIIKNMI